MQSFWGTGLLLCTACAAAIGIESGMDSGRGSTADEGGTKMDAAGFNFEQGAAMNIIEDWVFESRLLIVFEPDLWARVFAWF